MLTDDIFDLVKKIAQARKLPVTVEEIEQAKSNIERKSITLDQPLPVDINYDTQVVEGGVLHLYADVYEQGTNTVENLRNELQGVRISASKLDDTMLREMLERVSRTEQFVVRLADIRRGRGLTRGRTEPLTPQPANENNGATERGSSSEARGT